jgi:hypothetical protein
MNLLPFWLQVLQALSTPAFAMLALVVGVAQWRTSHQRAAFDLFDKRWRLYDEWRSVIGEVVREGTAPLLISNRYLRAIDQAEFLFGKEVYSYLIQTHKDILDLDFANTMMKTNDKDRSDWVEKRYAAFGKVAKFYETIGPLVAPYICMRQRAPWF